MSLESKLIPLREALEKINSDLFITLSLRRSTAIEVQKLKGKTGQFPHFDPKRENELFLTFRTQLSSLSEKELLAFSLIMEDQAMALNSDSYPAWSQFAHLSTHQSQLYEMVNPLMLKVVRPNLFNKLSLGLDFSFLKDF